MRKHLKTFMFYDEHQIDIDTVINSWLNEIQNEQSIFDVLDIKVSTSYSKEYEYIITVMIIYTEKYK